MVYKILSIDGGGIRGAIAASLLKKIEEESIASKSLYDSFDLFAGTSTGSIITSAISLKKKACEIVKLYKNRAQTIFPYKSRWALDRIRLIGQSGISAPKYDAAGLRQVLESELGSKSTFGKIDKKKRLLITSYDTIAREKLTFDSADSTFSLISLWEAALSSSSAPTFFPANQLFINKKEYSLIDGGVVANNPTVLAIATAIASGKKPEDIKVLSVGTGDPTREIPFSWARNWGLLEWAAPIVDVLFDGASDVNHFIAGKILPEENYLRLQFKLNGHKEFDIGRLSDDIDDASPDNIENLILAGEKFFDREEDRIKMFFDSLDKNQ